MDAAAADKTNSIPERLRALVVASLDEATGAWLRGRLTELASGTDRVRLMATYAGIGRRLRGINLVADESLVRDAAAAGLTGLAGWSAVRAARSVVLVAAVEGADPTDRSAIVSEIHRSGDNGEREALLGALLLLPEPERFVEVAVDACRSNVESVFASIACENAFPARHFSDASFNQMVLKAVFIGLSLSRMIGLDERTNAELARMARDFASERRAAGRSVSADLELLLSMHMPDAERDDGGEVR